MSERAVPFHCPYCGDEDLRPHEVVSERRGHSPHGPGSAAPACAPSR